MDGASVLLIRGLFGVGVGLLALLWPGLTVAFLAILFGAYAFLDGVTNLVFGMRRTPGQKRPWFLILQGIASVFAGIVTFLWPAITAFVLLVWIAVWAIITGAFEIAAALRLRREIEGEWRLALGGAISIALGCVLLAFPALGAIGLAWALGAYSVASGILFIALAIRMRTAPILV